MLGRGSAARSGALVALLALAGCAGDDRVPPELIGYWTTVEPRYAGRAFELTDSTLTIFTAPEDSSVYAITGTEREVDGGDLTVTIAYENAGDQYLFRLGYGLPGADGDLEWVHPAEQPSLEWRKSPRVR